MSVSAETQRDLTNLVTRMFATTRRPLPKTIATEIDRLLNPENYPDNERMGRPEIRDRIVARCYIQPHLEFIRGDEVPKDILQATAHVNGNVHGERKGGWDNSRPEIKEARRKWNLGMVDLATGRDGDWLILYAFPRRRRDDFRFRDQHFRTNAPRDHGFEPAFLPAFG